MAATISRLMEVFGWKRSGQVSFGCVSSCESAHLVRIERHDLLSDKQGVSREGVKQKEDKELHQVARSLADVGAKFKRSPDLNSPQLP